MFTVWFNKSNRLKSSILQHGRLINTRLSRYKNRSKDRDIMMNKNKYFKIIFILKLTKKYIFAIFK